MKSTTFGGLVLILYAFFVIYITIKRPKSIWQMKKIKIFINLIGERGTVILFFVWSALVLSVAVFLLTK